MYVLDEPSIGLHQRDNDRLIGTLKHLRDIGNSVIVVEHDEDAIRAADYVVDMGPGAGVHGGEVVARGHAGGNRWRIKQSLTGQYMSGPTRDRDSERPHAARSRTGCSSIGAHGQQSEESHARAADRPAHLHDGRFRIGQVDADQRHAVRAQWPAICTVRAAEPAPYTMLEGLEHFDKVISVDQSPIGRTPRSNPATYTGLFTPIRELFAETPTRARARLRGRPLLLQRQGRTLRGLPGRRRHQGRDALPAGRLRAVRRLPWQALQPRNAGGAVQGQEHRRRARHDRRGSASSSSTRCQPSRASCRRCSTSAWAT